MKRITLLAILFIVASTIWGKTRVQLSFTGSPSVNWMSTNNQFANKEKLVLGYDFGINGDVFFTENERYSLLTGLQSVNTGGENAYRMKESFQFAGVTLPASTQIRYRLRYVEIPLAIKLKTNQFDRVRYWGQFGLSPMVNIGATGDSNDGQLKKTDINHEINMFNLAMNVGAGFDFDLGGNNAVTAGVVFENGLIDATTDHALTDKTVINSLKFKIGLIF
jgi:hypothetical protein